MASGPTAKERLFVRYQGSWIVESEEELHQILVRRLGRKVLDVGDLDMTCASTAHLPVRGFAVGVNLWPVD